MKIILTTAQARMLKNVIEEQTLRLMAEDDKGHTDARGTVWHTSNTSKIEKLDRIWEKIDKALEAE